jgi:hypothetical protein
VARFGEDNADYLMATLGEWSRRYERAALVDTGLGDDSAAEAYARGQARERGWRFERVPADLSIVRRLIFGEWDDDIAIIRPGEQLEMSFDEGIVRALPA